MKRTIALFALAMTLCMGAYAANTYSVYYVGASGGGDTATVSIATGTVSLANATSATVTISGFESDHIAIISNTTDPSTDDTEVHVQRYDGHFDVVFDAATTVTVGYLAILG